MCSVDLDAACASGQPHAARWDYVLVIDNGEERAVAVEVHSATPGDVDKMIAKMQWAQAELHNAAPATRVGKRDWYWVASGRVNIPGHLPQAKRLASSGLQRPTSHLRLA